VGAIVMGEFRAQPSKHTFVKTKRLLDDFFKVDEYRGSFETYDSSTNDTAMSAEQRLLVFERGDSVAALVVDPAHREVILVEQFRLPTTLRGGNGWILELPAGILQPGETGKFSMMRELSEETGYQVSRLSQIATFYVSPGGTSERILLFYAEVRRTQQTEKGGGIAGDGEDIRIVRMPIAEFFAKLRNQEFEDAKLIIAGQWLRERRALMPADDARSAPPVEFKVAREKTRGKSNGEQTVGYMTGNIDKVEDVDAWVNPMVSDMLLDRFTDRTVSGVIRARGAEKYPDGQRIKFDTIGEELRRAMNGRYFVSPGSVIDTSAGALEKTNKVKRIFHVAVTHGEFGGMPHVELDTLDHCIDSALTEIEHKGRYRSALIPMIGTGEGALPVNQVAPRLLRRALEFFRQNPKARLKKIYFLAYSEVDADILADAFKAAADEFEQAAADPQPGEAP
jgi:nudix-type nucleoside diphosphatase (YffH/AdpP family)